MRFHHIPNTWKSVHHVYCLPCTHVPRQGEGTFSEILTWFYSEIELDNLAATEIQDISYINKVARQLEVSILTYSATNYMPCVDWCFHTFSGVQVGEGGGEGRTEWRPRVSTLFLYGSGHPIKNNEYWKYTWVGWCGIQIKSLLGVGLKHSQISARQRFVIHLLVWTPFEHPVVNLTYYFWPNFS